MRDNVLHGKRTNLFSSTINFLLSTLPRAHHSPESKGRLVSEDMLSFIYLFMHSFVYPNNVFFSQLHSHAIAAYIAMLYTI